MTRTHITRTIIAAAIAGGSVIGAGVLSARREPEPPSLTTELVTRGPVVRTVAAMGTLEPVTTVAVGTQVSGSIRSLHADFNTIVRKGQVLARLDPALLQSAIEQARASLVRAEAEQDRLAVALADAVLKRDRARELADRHLIPAAELQAADVASRSAEAQVRSAAAQVTQARASLRQAEVDLAKTVITSPIDGIVIARNVDVGQTVAASLQAPTLFVLAAGLDAMQVKASVDEADVGSIAAGQPVTFTVDAYPQARFAGVVRQVRLTPVVEQNVVTYSAIIDAPNPRLQLKPGLTAHVTIEVARRDAVLRVPAAALRFRPPAGMDVASTAHATAVEGPALWQFGAEGLRAHPVTTGLSDGTHVEIVSGDVEEGDRVVTRAAVTATAAAAPRAASPLMSTPRLR